MMLLTDGTVMAQGGGVSKDWYKLTPDSTGNYHNGTWSSLASMSLERLYFGSNVLPDGRVYVLGGEYSGANGAATWVNSGEIYDTISNTWSTVKSFPKSAFGDGQTNLLSSGLILAGDLSSTETFLYDPSNDTWIKTGNKIHGDRSNEETWALLPDGSIISADVFVPNRAQRYMPDSGQWVDAGTIPVTLTGSQYGFEMGPGTLLPDGRYFQTGANEQSAIYDPKSNTWTAGPPLPAGLGADDSPGAMLPNGHFIYAVDRPLFNAPTRLFDYNPFSNSWTEVTPSQLSGQLNQSAYISRMLILPNGNMLMTTGSNQLWELTADSGPDPSWAPVVTDISHSGNVYTVKGMQLNGLWEGATYGEDAEMSTNYPIAKLTDANGVVTYARTLNWTAAVATGTKIVSTDFILPNNMGPGPIKLNIIANGIASRTIGNIDDAIIIAMDPSASYVEDSAPIVVSPSATISASVTNFNQTTLTIQVVANADSGDLLGVADTNEITVQGNNLFYQGTSIGQITSNTGSSESMLLNSNATLNAVQELIRAVSYTSTSQAPSTLDRSLLVILDNGVNGSVGTGQMVISVSATNDAPVSNAAVLPSVLEDTVFVSGTTIGNFTTTSVFDPDANASVSGIVLVENATPASEGEWQYAATNIGQWQDVPAIQPTNGLAISRQGRLRFLPALDFSGPVTPLRYVAIDETYPGTFSTNSTPVFLDVTATTPTGAISQASGNIRINVTPVNDPPVAVQQSFTILALQGQPIDQTLPNNLFFDIDSTLTYSFSDVGGVLSEWLHVDSNTLQLTGTPGNQNVGTLYLQLTASDGENLAHIQVTITVQNVNDAPEQLRMTGGSIEEGRSGVPVGKLFGIDPDSDFFAWKSSDPRFFVRDGQIIVNTELNFESLTDRDIPVTFTALDAGTPPLGSTLDVVIHTLDVNESYPQLNPTTYTIDTATLGGSIIDQFSAIDADTEQTVHFRLRSGDVSSFAIDSQTGEFRLAENVTLIPNTQYKVFVEAFDDGTPSFSTTAQITVDVVPANFFAPEFATNQSVSFVENLPAGTRVGKINISDLDGNPIVFDSIELDHGATDWITIDQSTGELFLTANHQFDFETQKQFVATITAHEDLNGGNSVTGDVVLRITNLNDKPSGLGALQIYPNRLGTPVTTAFQVIDQDPSASGYQFTTADPRFEIRQGRLALKPNQMIDASQVGQQLDVSVVVADLSDPNSQSVISAAVQVVAALPWQNPVNHLDVNRDGRITSSDVLLIINLLNSNQQSKVLATPRPFSSLGDPDFDVNGSNSITPADALEVINFLNARSAGPEGESPAPALNQLVDSNTWAMALQQVVTDFEAEFRRKK